MSDIGDLLGCCADCIGGIGGCIVDCIGGIGGCIVDLCECIGGCIVDCCNGIGKCLKDCDPQSHETARDITRRVGLKPPKEAASAANDAAGIELNEIVLGAAAVGTVAAVGVAATSSPSTVAQPQSGQPILHAHQMSNTAGDKPVLSAAPSNEPNIATPTPPVVLVPIFRQAR